MANALSRCLKSIYEARIKLGEQRRLALAAVRTSTAVEVPECEAQPINTLEVAPEAVASSAGLPQKPTISVAKQWLRAAGSRSLASRLGRLSKGRNVTAHPDVTLLRDIAAITSDSRGFTAAAARGQLIGSGSAGTSTEASTYASSDAKSDIVIISADRGNSDDFIQKDVAVTFAGKQSDNAKAYFDKEGSAQAVLILQPEEDGRTLTAYNIQKDIFYDDTPNDGNLSYAEVYAAVAEILNVRLGEAISLKMFRRGIETKFGMSESGLAGRNSEVKVAALEHLAKHVAGLVVKTTQKGNLPVDFRPRPSISK